MTPNRNPFAAAMTAIAATLLLEGCGQGPSPAVASGTREKSPAAATSTAASTASIPKAASSASDKPADTDHPSLKVTTLDGAAYDLASQRGHWVVINFWATWCGPCLQEIPDLTGFAKSRHDVAVIGLDYEEIEKPELQAFLKKHTPGYPIAMIDTFHPPHDFDAPRALPTTYLIGPDGHLVKKFLGPITIKELQQQIDHAKPAS